MTDKPLTDGDREMQAFLADCEKMSAIELEHHLKGRRIKATWNFAVKRMLDQKRLDEEMAQQRETGDLSRRNTAAAESQAATAESANKKSNLAIWISAIALLITALDALCNFAKG